jgi:hypothetical protein
MSVPKRRSTRYMLLAMVVSLTACASDLFPVELLDGARKSEDIALFVAVQRADELSSGNATLGEAGAIGKPGSVRLSVRASSTTRATPHLTAVPIVAGPSQPTTLPVTEGGATSVLVDGSLSLWRGIGTGEFHVGGINLLGRAALVNSYGDNPLEIDSDGDLSFGIGIRLGVTEETARMPAIALSWMYQALPPISFRPDPLPLVGGGSMSLALRSTNFSARQFRVAASKQFGNLGVTAGYGNDDLMGGAELSAAMVGPGLQPAREWGTHVHVRRNLLFVGGSYSLGRITLAGEAGRRTGSSAYHTNDFAGQGEWERSYFSLGVTVGR